VSRRASLPRLPRESDLRDAGAEAYVPIASRSRTTLEATTVQHVRNQLLAAELATPEEIETHLANLARGDLDLMLAPMITARGRKPGWEQGPVADDAPRTGIRGDYRATMVSCLSTGNHTWDCDVNEAWWPSGGWICSGIPVGGSGQPIVEHR